MKIIFVTETKQVETICFVWDARPFDCIQFRFDFEVKLKLNDFRIKGNCKKRT